MAMSGANPAVPATAVSAVTGAPVAGADTTDVAKTDIVGLGRLTPLADIRDIWKTEAYNFTPWLFENLDVLSDALGIALTPVAMEYPVGPFRLDIRAADVDERPVAIENQIGGADHSHLGQLILYSAHINAATAIWVTSNFRDEQRQALLWLNESTVDGVRFFGVEVGVVQIGDSAMAPVFNVVVRPNDLQKAESNTPQSNETNVARRAFLDQVMVGVAEQLSGFKPPTGPSYQNSIAFRSGPFGYFPCDAP